MVAMFTPTHLAHIPDTCGVRAIALQRTYASESIEVFLDCDGVEFIQDTLFGVTGWAEYQIRKLEPQEQLPSGSVRPVGPLVPEPYRPAGLHSPRSEPSTLSC